MKNLLYFRKSGLFHLWLILLSLGFQGTLQAQNIPSGKTGQLPESAVIDFVENKGQWNEEARFRADLPYGAVFMTNEGLVYNYASREELEGLHEQQHGKHDEGTGFGAAPAISMHAYKVIFSGADKTAGFLPDDKRGHYLNFFLGNDPSKWAGNVKAYGKVIRKNIYSGVDLAVYAHGSSMKYDFIVAAGADPDQINLLFEGVQPVLDNAGNVVIRTSVNEIKELAPYCYQLINGKEVPVKSRYKIAKNVLSFIFPGGYDRNYPLIIDPTLEFATFSGGKGSGSGYYAYSTTYDREGNTYASSGAYHLGWPVTTGAFQSTFAGNRDVTINKYSSDGSQLIYSTYYGGSNLEFPNAMKVNANNELVVIGSTNSSNLPVTDSCYDKSLGGICDIFVAHFNTGGTALVGATYLGGSGSEFRSYGTGSVSVIPANFSDNNNAIFSPMELNFDKDDNIWIAGNSNSQDIEIVDLPSANSYTVNKRICYGSTYLFGNKVLSRSGRYEERFKTTSGCDSIVKLNLVIERQFRDTLSVTLCPGGTYTFDGRVIDTAGIYTGHFNSVLGCDSISVLNLKIRSYVITDTLRATLCPGGSYSFGDRIINRAGMYIDTFRSWTGCDSISILALEMGQYNVGDTVNVRICPGDTYTFGDRVIHAGGMYVDTFKTDSGCDSIAVVNLEEGAYIRHDIAVQICPMETYLFGDKLLNEEAIYVDTFHTVECDSIVTLSLSVLPYVYDTLKTTFCKGSIYYHNKKEYKDPGMYTDTLAQEEGCPVIFTLSLSEGEVSVYWDTVTICPGSSYYFGDKDIKEEGVYDHTFTAGTSCDSMVYLSLYIQKDKHDTISVHICDGSDYPWGSDTLRRPGFYTQTFVSGWGCDSTVTISFDVLPLFATEVTDSICAGVPYIFGDKILTVPGTYRDTLKSASLCDSIVTLNLIHIAPAVTRITGRVCPGKNYVFGTDVLTDTGVYTYTFRGAYCDSTVILTLMQYPDTFTYVEQYCKGSTYYFFGRTLTEAGTYYQSFSRENGCDSLVRLILTAPWRNNDTLSGGFDVVLFKVDPTCSRLLYSSYLGGTDDDAPTGMIFNNAGLIIISGQTLSGDYPTTPGALRTTASGNKDGFVTMIHPEYGTMVRSTYLGTSAPDVAAAVQADRQDMVYILGTTSGDYPISPGVWTGDTTGDIFVEKLDPFLEKSLLSTRLGNSLRLGSARYFPSAFLVDICRNVYVAGYNSQGNNKPLSEDAAQRNPASFWFGVLKPDFEGLLYGSYFGVSGDHGHCGISRMDPAGVVYHSVCCNSGSYPGTTANSYAQTKWPSIGQDVVSFKFDFESSGVNSIFALADGLNDTGCAPYTVRFNNNSTAAINYVWDFGDNTPLVYEKNPQHIFTDTGTFTVTLYANNPGACVTDDTSSMEITILRTDLPVITVRDTIICSAISELELNVDIENPTANTVISWEPVGGVISGADKTKVIVNPQMFNSYYVTVKDTIPGICGLSTTDTVHIDMAPRELRILNGDTTVCEGDAVKIRAWSTPAYSYRWTPADGVSDTTALEPDITILKPEVYTLTASYEGCTDTTVSISIDMHHMPELTLGPDKAVCSGTEVALDAKVSPFRNDYSYQWEPDEGLTGSKGPNASLTAKETTVYSLTVTTPIGCASKGQIKVTVYPSDFGSVINDTGFCPGNTVQLWAEGGTSYLWTPSYGLSDTTVPDPVAQPATPTRYTVYITNEHNCKDTQSVFVNLFPAATLNLPDSVTIYPGEEYHITPGTNCVYFQWFPPSGISNTDIADPVVHPEVRTRYFVTAHTEHGCAVQDSIDVLVEGSIIDMPNAFMPSGSNTVFKPSKKGIVQLNNFSIFNRWGEKVFYTTDIDEGWDGTYKGQPQPLGVYIYVIEAVTDSGKTFVKKGNVTLLK